jgi:hypothetical protein
MVSWMITHRETAALANRFSDDTCKKQHIHGTADNPCGLGQQYEIQNRDVSSRRLEQLLKSI